MGSRVLSTRFNRGGFNRGYRFSHSLRVIKLGVATIGRKAQKKEEGSNKDRLNLVLSRGTTEAWRASSNSELIHTDLCGPMKTSSQSVIIEDQKIKYNSTVGVIKQNQRFKSLVENQISQVGKSTR